MDEETVDHVDMRLDNQLDVDEEDHPRVEDASSHPEGTRVAVVIHCVHLERVDYQKKKKEALQNAFHYPKPEHSFAEACVLRTN